MVSVVFGASAADLPDTIVAEGAVAVLQLHAEGAQIYQCEADASGRIAWQFREPIASLFSDGKTVRVHYVGPTWESSTEARSSEKWSVVHRAQPQKTSRG
jgi:hypothetical protein